MYLSSTLCFVQCLCTFSLCTGICAAFRLAFNSVFLSFSFPDGQEWSFRLDILDMESLRTVAGSYRSDCRALRAQLRRLEAEMELKEKKTTVSGWPLKSGALGRRWMLPVSHLPASQVIIASALPHCVPLKQGRGPLRRCWLRGSPGIVPCWRLSAARVASVCVAICSGMVCG